MSKIEQTLTSMEVAEMMGRKHDKLLETIRLHVSYMKELEQENGTSPEDGRLKYFRDSTYIAGNGQEQPCFDVTKIGCEFLAHKMKGIKGAEFTMRYIGRFHEMEKELSVPKLPTDPMEMLKIHYAALEQVDKKVDTVDSKVNNLGDRVKELEDTMTLDYGQQAVLGQTVNKTVLNHLGGKDAPAYKPISRRVFAECNSDLKHYFKVNARANVPKKRYEEAVAYAENWKPCTNTIMLIREYNSQNRLDI